MGTMPITRLQSPKWQDMWRNWCQYLSQTLIVSVETSVCQCVFLDFLNDNGEGKLCSNKSVKGGCHFKYVYIEIGAIIVHVDGLCHNAISANEVMYDVRH